MADKTQKKIDIKKFYIYIIALVSSIITFIFFYISNEIIKEEKIVKPKEDIYEIAKKEAIKLGRLEPDEKEIVKEIGPDGKVIIPSLSYVDIGGMGDNANKSVWTNIPNSKSFISFDIVFSSYKGEKLTDYLTDYDVDIRNIIYDEISKKKLADFEGSKGKKQLLEDIKNEMNAYLVEKDLDPVVFGAHYKVFAITTRK
tara:strand:+ start:197 stop:793 length:597 start_codon:yes stop_codon:yes gene_type:complete